MTITLEEIRKKQKWISKLCKRNGTTGRLELNVLTGEFSATEYISSSEYSPLPENCIAIPSSPNMDDIDYAIGASSKSEYLNLLNESLERRTLKILKKNGIEVI